MKDLFDREQDILDDALQYLETVKDQEYCEREKYAKLTKDYGRILKLVRRVTRVSDMTAVELNAAKIKLMGKVQYDGLTGIYNRRYFDDQFGVILKKCADSHQRLGVLMLDVDFFKLYNDTYGHSMGDDCLRKIAETMDESVPENVGFAARYGGEEFSAVLPGADMQEVQKIAERILHNIRALEIPHEKNLDRGYVTASIGGTSIEDVHENYAVEYISCADAALYQSKQTGRDRFTLQIYKEEEK